MRPKPAHYYEFQSRWNIPASAEVLYDILKEPAEYPSWWQGVTLRVREIAPGNADGTGKTALFEMSAFFPYTLKWQLRCVETARPVRIVSEASGDLRGTGVWQLEPHANAAAVSFTWNVFAMKPLLRYGSFLFRRAFIANHDRVMALCGQGLRKKAAGSILRQAGMP